MNSGNSCYHSCLYLSLVLHPLLAVTIVTIMVGMMFCVIALKIPSWIPAFIGVALIIVGIFGVAHTINAINRTSVFDYNKYKVTIDETVNARELLDKYEILSREGEIFTIKEIEVDEE